MKQSEQCLLATPAVHSHFTHLPEGAQPGHYDTTNAPCFCLVLIAHRPDEVFLATEPAAAKLAVKEKDTEEEVEEWLRREEEATRRARQEGWSQVQDSVYAYLVECSI